MAEGRWNIAKRIAISISKLACVLHNKQCNYSSEIPMVTTGTVCATLWSGSTQPSCTSCLLLCAVSRMVCVHLERHYQLLAFVLCLTTAELPTSGPQLLLVKLTNLQHCTAAVGVDCCTGAQNVPPLLACTHCSCFLHRSWTFCSPRLRSCKGRSSYSSN